MVEEEIFACVRERKHFAAHNLIWFRLLFTVYFADWKATAVHLKVLEPVQKAEVHDGCAPLLVSERLMSLKG